MTNVISDLSAILTFDLNFICNFINRLYSLFKLTLFIVLLFHACKSTYLSLCCVIFAAVTLKLVGNLFLRSTLLSHWKICLEHHSVCRIKATVKKKKNTKKTKYHTFIHQWHIPKCIRKSAHIVQYITVLQHIFLSGLC